MVSKIFPFSQPEVDETWGTYTGKLDIPKDDGKLHHEWAGKTHMVDIFTFYLFSCSHGQ